MKNTLPELDWEKGGGLLPAIVQSAKNGSVLMLGYMNQEALSQTLSSGYVTFFSRSRQCLWKKGETSGNVLELVDISVDCDVDTILVQAIPHGPTCHTGSVTCFGEGRKDFLEYLESVIDQRRESGDKESYVRSLFEKGTLRIAQKVGEEGVEVSLAAAVNDHDRMKEESADLLFHLLVCLRNANLHLSDVVKVLKSRHK